MLVSLFQPPLVNRWKQEISTRRGPLGLSPIPSVCLFPGYIRTYGAFLWKISARPPWRCSVVSLEKLAQKFILNAERDRDPMPHTTSAKKRLRQNKKRRMQNRAVKSELRTTVKKLLKSIKEKNAESASELLKAVASKLDKAGARHYLHPNTAARYKGRLTKRVLALKTN